MTVRAVAPRSIGAVLDSAWQQWRPSLRPLLPASAAFACMQFLPYLILSGFQGRLTLVAPRVGWAFALFEAGALIVYGFQLLWNLALFTWFGAQASGEAVALGAALKRARRLLPRRIRVALILAVMAGIVGFLFLAVFGVLANADRSHLLLYGCFTIGPSSVLLVYFWMRYSLSTAFIALEERKAVDSLEQSWRLTKGQGLRTTAVLAVLTAFFLVLYLLVGALASALDSLTGLPQALVPSQAILGVGILNPWAQGLYVSGLYALYVDLKARRQGEDLRLKVEQLAKA